MVGVSNACIQPYAMVVHLRGVSVNELLKGFGVP